MKELQFLIFFIFLYIVLSFLFYGIVTGLRKLSFKDHINYIIHYTTLDNINKIEESNILLPSGYNIKNKNIGYVPSIYFLPDNTTNFAIKFNRIDPSKHSYVKIKVDENLKKRLYRRRFDGAILYKGQINLNEVNYDIVKVENARS